ncbi:50S ribosomal protein L18 [Candidatus Woesearchaeota archaeon]|nr:50S ribosomal protein L18 [Candidatus Woesearchaeota archaeon]
MSTTTRTIPYRRRREDKTNYKKRLKLLLANKPRLVIRKSLKNIVLQVIEYGEKGDKIIASAHTHELKKYDWKYNGGNIPSAYLTGLLIGKKAAKKCKEVIVDLGLQNPAKGTRLYAAMKGAIDAGLQTPHDPSIFPAEARIKGEHIAKNTLLKEAKAKDISKAFEECKQKILKA